MGYNTNILLAKSLDQDLVANIIPDVFEITNDLTDFENASSYSLSPNFAMGKADEWTIIWDAKGKLALDRLFIKEFAISEAISFELSSISDRYQMLYARENKIIREVIYERGEKIIEKGQMIKGETESMYEQKVWQSIEQMTEITFAKLESLKYNLVMLD